MRNLLSSLAQTWRQRYIRQVRSDISLALADQTITLVDIGAAGGLLPRWQPVADKVSLIAFEPDERSNAALLAQLKACAKARVVPFAVWSENCVLDINFCRKPTVSSHFEPNLGFLRRFSEADRFDIVGKVMIEARTLDSLELGRCDFVKLDIQGGELGALQGAAGTLSGVFGVECEVEFVEYYKNQPLFGDICRFLSGKGIEFVDFLNLGREDLEHGKLNYGQCGYADALFLRMPHEIASKFNASVLGVADLRRYAGILILYNRFDSLKKLNQLASRTTGEARTFLEASDRIVDLATRRWHNKRSICSLASYISSFCDREMNSLPMY